MVEKRQGLNTSLLIVAMVSIVAIVILVSNSSGNLVGERTSGFRLVSESEVPTRDKVVAPFLHLTLWNQFIYNVYSESVIDLLEVKIKSSEKPVKKPLVVPEIIIDTVYEMGDGSPTFNCGIFSSNGAPYADYACFYQFG